MKTSSLLVFGLVGPLLSLTAVAAEAPSAVLIHGANFSSASLGLVKEDLAEMGIPVLVPDLYRPDETLTLSDVSSRLCDLLAKQPKPVVLVGHSQGGAIITQAAASCASSVKALVYIAAVVPSPDEGVFDALSEVDNQNYAACASLNARTNAYDLDDFDACRKVFMQDASLDDARAFYGTMVSEPAGIGNSKAAYSAEALSSIPKFYIQTRDDLIISFETQQKIISGKDFVRVLALDSSHTPFFAKHRELSAILASEINPPTEVPGAGLLSLRSLVPGGRPGPGGGTSGFCGGGPLCGRGHDCGHPCPPRPPFDR